MKITASEKKLLLKRRKATAGDYSKAMPIIESLMKEVDKPSTKKKLQKLKTIFSDKSVLVKKIDEIERVMYNLNLTLKNLKLIAG